MVFFPQVHNPGLITRKHRKIQTDGNSTEHLMSTSHNCQGHERQGKPKKLSETGRDERDVTRKGNLELKKDISGKTGVVLIKSVVLQNSNVPTGIFSLDQCSMVV